MTASFRFSKLAKLAGFGIFSPHNIECDFSCDFQTPCLLFTFHLFNWKELLISQSNMPETFWECFTLRLAREYWEASILFPPIWCKLDYLDPHLEILQRLGRTFTTLNKALKNFHVRNSDWRSKSFLLSNEWRFRSIKLYFQQTIFEWTHGLKR